MLRFGLIAAMFAVFLTSVIGFLGVMPALHTELLTLNQQVVPEGAPEGTAPITQQVFRTAYNGVHVRNLAIGGSIGIVVGLLLAQGVLGLYGSARRSVGGFRRRDEVPEHSWNGATDKATSSREVAART